MKDNKKNEFYATSVKCYLSDNESKYNQEGYIQLNFRDMPDNDLLLKAITHEAYHILGDKPGKQEEILQYLKDNINFIMR